MTILRIVPDIATTSLAETRHFYVALFNEARQVNPALSAMRNKTDKTDARGIAQVLAPSQC